METDCHDLSFEIDTEILNAPLKAFLGSYLGVYELGELAKSQVMIDTGKTGKFPIGTELIDEQQRLFSEKHWMDFGKAMEALLPCYGLLEKEIGIPKWLIQYLPDLLLKWIYSQWWRQKLPNGYFSKSKGEGIGDQFNIAVEGSLEMRTKLADRLEENDPERITPKWVLDELRKPDSDAGNLYGWANSLENLMQIRLSERDFAIFQQYATSDGFLLSKNIVKYLELDLIEIGFWKTHPDKHRWERSFKRFKNFRPEKTREYKKLSKYGKEPLQNRYGNVVTYEMGKRKKPGNPNFSIKD